MTIPSSPTALASILRLSGLKNAGRRVSPGSETLQGLEDFDTDVSGTAAPENVPQMDMGGELNPQSYDVRANSANPESEQEGIFSKLSNLGRVVGTAFSDYVNPEKRQEMSNNTRETQQRISQPQMIPPISGDVQGAGYAPPIETEQVDEQEGLPPISASQEAPLRAKAPELNSSILGSIADYFSPTKRAQAHEYNQEISRDAQLRASGQNPDEVRLEAQKTQDLKHEQNKALQQPWQYAAYGSAEQVANHPALSAEFKKITGIDYTPQIAAQVKNQEEGMKGVEDAINGINDKLSEQGEAAKQRILNNQTTDSDKYFIGLALMMPLLVGGFFGAEAGLGALGGAAKGVADVLGNRQKAIREDEASLLDISKQQAANQEKLANIGIEKSKLGPSLRKSLPEDTNAHLVGMREGMWQDPMTGEEIRGVEVKPGLIARPEFVATKEGKADMLKAANELSEVKTYVDEVNDVTEDIVNIVSQLDDPSFAWKGFTSMLSGRSPTILSRMTQDVMLNGRKVNAGIALEEKLGFLANAYGMAKDIGQLDRAAQAHIKKIIENPTSTFLTPEDSLNQVLEIRKLAQRGLISSASNKGFYPEFVIGDIQKANKPLMQGLNQSEDENYLSNAKKNFSKVR